jgi:hypothetical protein
MIQRLIALYFKRKLKWKDTPVILELEAYNQLTKAAANALLLAAKNASLVAKLEEIGYDFDTDEVYYKEYEQAFAEITEDGEWVEAPEDYYESLEFVNTKKKKTLN